MSERQPTLREEMATLRADLAEALADTLHPFATEHRYELAGRLQNIEVAVRRIEERLSALEINGIF